MSLFCKSFVSETAESALARCQFATRYTGGGEPSNRWWIAEWLSKGSVRSGPLSLPSWLISETSLERCWPSAWPVTPPVCPFERHDPGQSWRSHIGCALPLDRRALRSGYRVTLKAAADNQLRDPSVTRAVGRSFAPRQPPARGQKGLILLGFLKGMVGAPGLEPGTR